ncbi:hypothetical protein [uncultured Alistipes sp.]|uniref:hypothetical protein n=1 Tax=uncultured Alistipes sp. TaxID=538949 RepID=UPI0025DCF6D3|nr:hypothetical protein [uncultured Alistipes sp.]
MITEQALVRTHILHGQSYVVAELLKHGSIPEESLHGEWWEVLEWWLVTDWLADRLKEQDEIILEEHDCCWWGRTCSGQAIYMDAVMTHICESLG